MIDIFGIELALDAKFFLVIAAVVAGGLVRGFAGFGSALVIVPPLAILFGPQVAVAMEVIIEIPVTLSLLPAAVKHAKRDVIFPMLVAILVAIPIGTLALKLLDPEPMKIVSCLRCNSASRRWLRVADRLRAVSQAVSFRVLQVWVDRQEYWHCCPEVMSQRSRAAT